MVFISIFIPCFSLSLPHSIAHSFCPHKNRRKVLHAKTTPLLACVCIHFLLIMEYRTLVSRSRWWKKKLNKNAMYLFDLTGDYE